jgi:ribosomal-protein-alanine N-acetyltransferase
MPAGAIVLKPMTSDAVSAIADWRYDPPYDFYDLDADPDDLAEFLDPETWHSRFAAFDGDDLVGFFTFNPSGDDLVIGLGLRPDRTGRGLGHSFVQAGLEFAVAHYSPTRIVLAVAEFNHRARRLYAKLGFSETRTFEQATNGGTYPFIEMVRHP